MDVVSKKKSPKQALKNTISNTVKKQTGLSALRMRQTRKNHRRSKRSRSKESRNKRKIVISKRKQPKRIEFGRISLPKLKMIGNIIPTEATHSSLDLFEKPALLVTIDVSFCRKVGPVYSPIGPMLEFEVAGDRSNFIDLQKIFLEIKCKIVQASEADLKYDAGAATDVTKTEALCFCNNVLHSLFSDCTVSANGLNTSDAYGNYARKTFIETKLSHNKDAKTLGLLVKKVIRTKITLKRYQELKLVDEKLWLDNLLNA